MKYCYDDIKNLKDESKTILSIIQKKGPMSKRDLTKLTGYKLTTLNRFMKKLFEMNLIEEVGVNNSTGGRPSANYDINSRDYYVVGIDISRLYTTVCLNNLKMKVIQSVDFKMDKRSSSEKVISNIINVISDFKKKYKDKVILGIGIGTVGPLDRNQGIILTPENFPCEGWYNIDIVNIIKNKTNLPVILDNGANLAVLSECYFGSGKGFNNIAYFNCGIGIRTGVMISKKIIRTINDSEDTFAHMVIDIDGKACSCGARGCIESISSIVSIIDSFKDEVKKGNKTLIDKPIESINFIDICKAAEASDETASKVILNAAEAMGIGISNFIKILNLDYIIMNGPLVNNSILFYNKVVSTAMGNYYKLYKNGIYFNRGGQYGQNAIAIGGSVNIVESMLMKG